MKKALSQIIFLVIVLALLAVVPLISGPGYWIMILYTLSIYIILAEGWNIIGGFGGQVFLGTAAFFGWGAYSCTLLCVNAKLPFAVCILFGGLASMLLAAVLTPTLKLRGVYFVVGSLFISEIMKIIVLMLPVTGGAAGIVLPLFGERIIFTYYSVLLLMFIVILTELFLIRSRIGMALRAIRDDQDAAEMFGVNSMKLKFLALLLTALFSGIAGGIHAFYMIYVEPHSFFDPSWNVIPVFMALVGGASTLTGPVVGVMIYTLMRELFIFVAGEIYLTMLGALLIAVILFAPEGIYPLLLRTLRRIQVK